MFPHPINPCTHILVSVTSTFHIYTLIFYNVLKNSNNRTDILNLIFYISTYKSSYHLYTCEGVLGVLSTIQHGLLSICSKISRGGYTSLYTFSTYPHPIYRSTSIPIGMTSTFQIGALKKIQT